MSAISLVICVYKERELLQRLLLEAADCFDELIVVHDGPDTEKVREIVISKGGKFFEHPRIGSLEGQSPFAWAQASHDWILRLDADEFPSPEMKAWLNTFRISPEPAPEISGYTCIWPLWNGQRTFSERWPAGRIFLFNRQCVRFFGLVEQVPIPDGRYQDTGMILHHQPRRASHSLGNILFRRQAYRWRRLIARGLLGRPTDLPCWRWDSSEWPLCWEQIRQRPLYTAVKRLTIDTLRGLRDQWRTEKKIYPLIALCGPIHHALLACQFWCLRLINKPQK